LDPQKLIPLIGSDLQKMIKRSRNKKETVYCDLILLFKIICLRDLIHSYSS